MISRTDIIVQRNENKQKLPAQDTRSSYRYHMGVVGTNQSEYGSFFF